MINKTLDIYEKSWTIFSAKFSSINRVKFTLKNIV